MRIFLIIILIFAGTAYCAVLAVYGMMPSRGGFSAGESGSNKAASEISQEKEKIIEDITPARETREKNLHPFVQPALNLPPAQEAGNIQSTQVEGGSFYAARQPKNETPDIIDTAKSQEPQGHINFVFISIIVLAFLLSYFFIRPRSK